MSVKEVFIAKTPIEGNHYTFLFKKARLVIISRKIWTAEQTCGESPWRLACSLWLPLERTCTAHPALASTERPTEHTILGPCEASSNDERMIMTLHDQSPKGIKSTLAFYQDDPYARIIEYGSFHLSVHVVWRLENRRDGRQHQHGAHQQLLTSATVRVNSKSHFHDHRPLAVSYGYDRADVFESKPGGSAICE